MSFNSVPQEEPMGCAVACAASLFGVSYKKAVKLFGKNYNPKVGSFCNQIICVLRKAGLNYKYSRLTPKTKKFLNVEGTIVFIKPTKKFPFEHYLLKTKNGWMDSWINIPKMNPAKAGFQKNLPGKPQWLIYKK